MAAQERSVTIAVEPLLPLIECRDNQQLLNFDFALHNGGNATLRLREIEVVAFDQSGAVTLKKTVNSNGLRPGIEVSLGLLHPRRDLRHLQPILLLQIRCWVITPSVRIPVGSGKHFGTDGCQSSPTAHGL